MKEFVSNVEIPKISALEEKLNRIGLEIKHLENFLQEYIPYLLQDIYCKAEISSAKIKQYLQKSLLNITGLLIPQWMIQL